MNGGAAEGVGCGTAVEGDTLEVKIDELEVTGERAVDDPWKDVGAAVVGAAVVGAAVVGAAVVGAEIGRAHV